MKMGNESTGTTEWRALQTKCSSLGTTIDNMWSSEWQAGQHGLDTPMTNPISLHHCAHSIWPLTLCKVNTTHLEMSFYGLEGAMKRRHIQVSLISPQQSDPSQYGQPSFTMRMPYNRLLQTNMMPLPLLFSLPFSLPLFPRLFLILKLPSLLPS
jgi:hypothetical protein